MPAAMKVGLLLLLLALGAAPRAANPWASARPETATAWLGFSGATLSIRSVFDPRRPGTARRRLTLVTAAGRRLELPLHDGGGRAGNYALDLYQISSDRFLLASERDCVEMDPIGRSLRTCRKPEACPRARTYVGRFDWMNGFDPPRGRFRLAFRYLPAHDAGESGGC
jgi:hypothetical protein